MCNSEYIPHEDTVSRFVDTPRTFDDARGLIWDQIFLFPKPSQIECVVWRKYAVEDDEVHALGCDRERSIRTVRSPDHRYRGFVSAYVRVIREVRIAAGHGFEVVHTPDEGRHHAEIRFKPVSETAAPTKAHRGDLRIAIQKAFGELVPHMCPDLPVARTELTESA